MWRHSSLLGAVLVYAAGVGLLTLATPIAVQALVSNVAFGTLLQPLVVLAALLFLGLGLRGGLKVMQAWVVEALQRQLFVDFAGEAATRLTRTSPKVLEERHGPELANRFFDIYTVQKSAASLLLGGLDAILTAGVGMVVLGFYHPILLAFDLVLVLVLAAWVGLLGRGGVGTAVIESKAKYALAHTLEQTLGQPLSTRSPQGRATVEQLIDQGASNYLVARSQHFRVVMRQLVGAVLLQAVSSAALLGVGGWLVIERQLTLGQLVAAEIIVTGVVAAFASLGKHAETYYDLLAALDKLGILLGLPHERLDGLTTRNEGTAASVSLLGLSTESGPKNVEIPAGARVRVVGSESAPCERMLGHLYGWSSGLVQRVRFDDLDTGDLSLDALRSQVAWVRGPEIWGGTVLENLRFEAPEADLAEVRRVLEMVGLEEVISALPDGLNTRLTPTGVPLAPHEALRLTLARALLRHPRVLLLGDAFDALRPNSRNELLQALASPAAPWTLVVCSYDKALDAWCSHSLDLEDGLLRECGR